MRYGVKYELTSKVARQSFAVLLPDTGRCCLIIPQLIRYQWVYA